MGDDVGLHLGLLLLPTFLHWQFIIFFFLLYLLVQLPPSFIRILFDIVVITNNY